MRKFDETDKTIAWVLITLVLIAIAILLWVAKYNAANYQPYEIR